MEEAFRPSLSVIVPAFDEGPRVRDHLRRIGTALAPLGRPFEILLVDDGSRDETAAEASAVARDDPRVRVLSHASNLGKGAALATGCLAARGDVLVFLDADLEIAPEQILPLLALLERDRAAISIGSKYLPGAAERRPLVRVLLSRLYRVVTTLFFRLPLSDTQTGLKILRADLARAAVPALKTRRWAWDLELLVVAHRAGARIVAGPVSVDFSRAATRIGLKGFVDSGLDTLKILARDRWLGAYGRAVAAARGARRSPAATRAIASGDDLGLSSAVDRGILDALARGDLTSASWLAPPPTTPRADEPLSRLPRGADLGVHVDLARGRLLSFLARSFLGLVPAGAPRAEVRRAVLLARAAGHDPSHVDAHRHAFLAPSVYRAVCAEAAALRVPAVRFPLPLGGFAAGSGLSGRVKAAVLFAASIGLRGIAHEHGLATPDGIADAATAERWVRSGRLPRSVRGRTVEVLAHPIEADGGDGGVPAGEAGIDRAADSRRVRGLLDGLLRLGVARASFRGLPRRPTT